MGDSDDWRANLNRLRVRRDHAGEQFLVAIAQAVDEHPGQRGLAGVVGKSQPQVSRLAAQGRALIGALDGRSGLSPYAVAARYAAGEIDRATLVRELSSWDYAEGADGLVPGGFGDVEAALMDGLIDQLVFEEIRDAPR